MNLGNSAAEVRMLPGCVFKRATGDEAPKLRASIAKQSAFMALGGKLRTPVIRQVFDDGDEVAMSMERIYDWSAHLWPYALRSLLTMVTHGYALARPQRFSAAYFARKTADIDTSTSASRAVVAYLAHAFRDGATLFAGGPTHGDLTLCNVLATHGSTYLIDFHVASVDCQLMELVKLRQDTHHHWCLQLQPGIVTVEALGGMDREVCALLATVPDREWYYPLAVLNLARKAAQATNPTAALAMLKAAQQLAEIPC